MQSVQNKIYNKIRRAKKGDLIFPNDFSLIGSSETIRVALHNLEKADEITRVAQGIYVKPKKSLFFNKILPTAEEIAVAIAKRDKIKILPTGSYALNALGLSTQVPMKIVLLTDGSPREIKIGKRTITFKKTTPKNLLAKGEISKLAIQALKEIGINKQTPEEEDKIIKLLKKENPKHLLHDIGLAPVWIQKIIKKALINE